MSKQTLSSINQLKNVAKDPSASRISRLNDELTHAHTTDNAPMLTTSDNPFDPFTQFDKWFAFDTSKGYHSCAYLARLANTSVDLSDSENDLAIEAAIDEIVQLNLLGIYQKVYRNSDKEKDPNVQYRRKT